MDPASERGGTWVWPARRGVGVLGVSAKTRWHLVVPFPVPYAQFRECGRIVLYGFYPYLFQRSHPRHPALDAEVTPHCDAGQNSLVSHCWPPRQARGDGDGLWLSLKATELLPTTRGRLKGSRRHLHQKKCNRVFGLTQNFASRRGNDNVRRKILRLYMRTTTA